MHNHNPYAFMNYGMCMVGIWNIGLPARVYNTRLRKKDEK